MLIYMLKATNLVNMKQNVTTQKDQLTFYKKAFVFLLLLLK